MWLSILLLVSITLPRIDLPGLISGEISVVSEVSLPKVSLLSRVWPEVASWAIGREQVLMRDYLQERAGLQERSLLGQYKQ